MVPDNLGPVGVWTSGGDKLTETLHRREVLTHGYSSKLVFKSTGALEESRYNSIECDLSR